MPRITELARMSADAMLVTLSSVGTARGTSARQVGRRHFARALELFSDMSNTRIDGFIASEVEKWGPIIKAADIHM